MNDIVGRWAVRGALGVMLLALPSGEVWAAGFYITPRGAADIGVASAGAVARAEEGSTLFSNPAGVTRLQRAFFQIGVDAISPDVKISNQGSTAATPGTLGASVPYAGTAGSGGDLAPVPNIYAATPVLNNDLWVGVAVAAPFGLKLDYSSDWFGRYDSTNNKLQTLDIAPTAAYRINSMWSIGAGIDIQYANAELDSAVPNTLNPGGPSPATDGQSQAAGHDWAAGFNVGVLFESGATRIGASYRSKIDHTIHGTTTVSGLTGPLAGANGTLATSTTLRLPDIANVGIAQQIGRDFTLLADVQWFGWSRFNEIRFTFDNGSPDVVRPQNYRNSIAAGVGGEYRLRAWTLRTGVRYEQTPTVDAYRSTGNPDSDVILAAVGATYAFSDHFEVDAGYFHAFFQSATINLTRTFFAGTPAAGTVNVRGETDNSGDVVSVAFRYKF